MVEFDVFVSYARADDVGGWVSALRDAVYEDFREFSSEPFRVFFDTNEIRGRDDWELRLREGLRSSRVLLVCLSPNYLRSRYCRWEWEEFARLQARRIGGGDAVTGVYFVELGGDGPYEEKVAAWRREVERVQFEQLAPWFPDGVAALQEDEVRRRVKALGQGVHDQLRQARLAQRAPGNLRRHNPWFVGRLNELRELRVALTGGSVGVVTAIHGLGGMGKTELAVSYAYSFAHQYQGGTWQVDVDGQSDVLEAVASLARSPELGLEVREEHLRDPRWLGRLALARLGELTTAAREDDPDSAACLLLLDNVSEPALLAASQLAVLPEEPWFHLVATTRLGLGDVAAEGSRASVAMIEVDRLGAGDALELIRNHQPARDDAKLRSDFSSPHEEAAAREIVNLLDGYTLAVEQAAVYLGSPGIEPSDLLTDLRLDGLSALDLVGASPGGSAILHEQRVTGVIVDQTLARLPQRARNALAYASLLPPDTIPWRWLDELTAPEGGDADGPRPRLRELAGSDWPSTRRALEGRRLLTLADDSQFARLHRVLQQHLRSRLVDEDALDRLDTYLSEVSSELQAANPPESTILQASANAIAERLSQRSRETIASAGLWLIRDVLDRLDVAAARSLAQATVGALETLARSDPDNQELRRDLAASYGRMADVLSSLGEREKETEYLEKSLSIAESLLETDPMRDEFNYDLSSSLDALGRSLKENGHLTEAKHLFMRSLRIRESLSDAHPADLYLQRSLSVALGRLGELSIASGDTDAAVGYLTRSLSIDERITLDEPTRIDQQRDLAVGLGTLGLALSHRGEYEDALRRFEGAISVLELAIMHDPSNTDLQRGMAVTLGWAGDATLSLGRYKAAVAIYTRSLTISENLAKLDPSNVARQIGLADSLRDLAAAHSYLDDNDEAAVYYSRAVVARQALAINDPSSIKVQLEFADALRDMGRLLETNGDSDGGLDCYTRSLDIRDRIARSADVNAGLSRGLAANVEAVGKIWLRRKDGNAAYKFLSWAIRLRTEISSDDPGNTLFQRELASGHLKLGEAAILAGDVNGAVESYSRSLEIRQLLSSKDPSDHQLKRAVGIPLTRLGEVAAGRGHLQMALNYFRQALSISENLARTEAVSNVRHQRDLAVDAYKMASTLDKLNDPSAHSYWLTVYRILRALEADGDIADDAKRVLLRATERLAQNPKRLQ